MINKNKKEKTYIEYKRSYPQQLDLFSFSNVFDSRGKEKYSGTVEIYDLVPKYFHDDVEKLRKNGKYLDILSRNFVYKKQKMQLNMTPARLLQKDGSSKDFFPSQREEIIEDVLRKFATNPNRNEFLDDRLSVRFTLYELWSELRKIKHTFSYDEIRESLEILAGTNLKIKTGDDKVTFSSNMFETFGTVDENENPEPNNEREEYNKKITYFVRFNSLVSESIKNKTWRIINYEQCMAYRKIISRWLHKRISHMFLCNKIELPYNILLSTIIRDSGMTQYNLISGNLRQVEDCLKEMISVGSIFKYEVEKIFSKEKANKIEDVKFLIYVSKSFFDDMKLGNLALFDSDKMKQIQDDSKSKYKSNNNQNFTNNIKDIDSSCVDNSKNKNTNTNNNIEIKNNIIDSNLELKNTFKKEIIEIAISMFASNNINLLTKDNIESIIDKALNSLSKITLETKNTLISNIKACINYIKTQEQSGKKCKPIAILTKSIKDNWQPNDKDLDSKNCKDLCSATINTDEARESNSKLVKEKIQDFINNISNNSSNKNIKLMFESMLNQFGDNIFYSWLMNMNYIGVSDKDTLTFSVETEFIKDWIVKDYLNGTKRKVNGESVWVKKGIQQLCQDIDSSIKKVELIVLKK